jgi:hypothetical protein
LVLGEGRDKRRSSRGDFNRFSEMDPSTRGSERSGLGVAARGSEQTFFFGSVAPVICELFRLRFPAL